jgi:hypothetical protein
MVVGWHPAVTGTDWRLLVGFEPDATLRLVAASGRFFVGDVPGCDVAPPDFVADDDATLAAGLAGWDSEISLSYCSPIRP